MLTMNPFDEKQVNKILSKIKFGHNLTEDQLKCVKALVCEFTDIFTLSISEVIFVD